MLKISNLRVLSRFVNAKVTTFVCVLTCRELPTVHRVHDRPLVVITTSLSKHEIII